MKQKNYLFALLLAGAGLGNSSCSLDEYNPSGYTFENVAASSVEAYKGILNNIYFGMERALYGAQDWMWLTEAGTDIWTRQKNADDAYFKYGVGSEYSSGLMEKILNCCYDGIGSCNVALQMADLAPFATEEEKNQLIAEAHFMRAVYYYHLVEQLGGVTLQMKPTTTVDLHPEKTAPLDIYKQCIIPDLEFAAQWLPVEERTTRPSCKSALGFLLKAYMQTVEYDAEKTYVSKALELAKDMISDLESGGSRYGIQMYATVGEVFAKENNFNNTEALWKHRFVQGGGSNEAWKLNRNDELFYCKVNDFSAIQFNTDDYTTGDWAGKCNYEIWGQRCDGQFMPSKYLLDLYLQDDGTLDPRYHAYFQTDWNCNKEKGYTWSQDHINRYGKTFTLAEKDDQGNYLDPVEGAKDRIEFGSHALSFIRPGDTDYEELSATKSEIRYLIADYADIYNADGTVKMRYANAVTGEEVDNPFYGFYPSLNKHNSDVYYVNNKNKKRFGNLNGTFMMRSPEIYLLAAEADIYINGGVNAMEYINKVRTRAQAKPLSGVATLQTVLDERARELCGEYVRFYDLKRMGMLTKEYLEITNYDVGQYFKTGKHELRPFPTNFLENLQDGGAYYQNPNY